MPPIVRDLIEAARVRHWAFTDVALGDGAALLFLNQRQRTHLAAHGAAIEGLVGESLEYSLEREEDTGFLVTLEEDGTPVFINTVEDGYPVHLTDDSVPYIDVDDTRISGDPFGEYGGTPGFPLPADLIRLIAVGGVYGSGGRNIPVDVIPERERWTRSPGRNPLAFVSGNRLVPVMPHAEPANNTNDRWHGVTHVQISYVAVQTLAAITDEVTLPSVLAEALTADVALLFARQSRECPPIDKRGFEQDAARAAAAVADAGNDMLDSVQSSTVIYRP